MSMKRLRCRPHSLMMTNGPSATIGEISTSKLGSVQGPYCVADDPRVQPVSPGGAAFFCYEKQRQGGGGFRPARQLWPLQGQLSVDAVLPKSLIFTPLRLPR